jgi:non-reducing end alpha-L-arabinofuranosidase
VATLATRWEFPYRLGHFTSGTVSGGLNTIYSGVLPRGYAPMRQEGAIVLGVGGDNSHAPAGSLFECIMTAGFPIDSTDNAIHSNIGAVGYGASTGLSGTPTPGSEISLQATTACCTGDHVRNQNGVAVIAPIASVAPRRTRETSWIVRRGLADNSCVSFESGKSTDDFLQHQNFALHMRLFDGAALNRSDATFCPQPRKNVTEFTGNAILRDAQPK